MIAKVPVPILDITQALIILFWPAVGFSSGAGLCAKRTS